MRVLIACEFSGVVRDAFRDLGHDAMSCDLLPTEVDGPHYQGDVRDLLTPGRWDLVVAHPPCTHLAVSGARHFAKKRADGRQQQGIDFFMLFTNMDCPLAIENPIGIMSRIYRKPDQIIHPWMFGDAVSKATCLWLHDLPPLMPTKDVHADVKYYIDPRGRRQSEWNARQIVVNGKKCGYDTDEFKRHRSKTFPGVAAAIAAQWGEFCSAHDKRKGNDQ